MSDLLYQSGFGNQFASEAIAGALPLGQNSPQNHPLGLYAEQLSGTAFTQARHANKRSWLYRIRPSVVHGDFKPYAAIQHAKILENPPPNQIRWAPLKKTSKDCDFIHGWQKLADNCGPWQHLGASIYLYQCNQSMHDCFFYNADAELLIVPQQGTLLIATEFGLLEISPEQIAVIPRGCKFQVAVNEFCRGYLCENHGAQFQLPDLGLLGSNGLANPRDFEVPVAHYTKKQGDFQLICKFSGNYFQAELNHHPLDVVAWHGAVAPYRYQLQYFNTMNSVSFDHPDPSIFTVLTSPGLIPGVANIDFVIFKDRWVVSEHTFRPPYYHRNVMSEFMGLINGQYDAKGDQFAPFGASLHNCMSAHGPDTKTFVAASSEVLKPIKYQSTLAFMLESSQPWRVTDFAWQCEERDRQYMQCWQDLPAQFNHE